jgi:recombination protein RecT
MTTEVAKIPEAAIVGKALEAMTPQLKASLPGHVSVEKFKRVAMTAIQNNPDLLQAERQSLYNSFARAAQDGLLPDNREAAIVTFGGRAQYMPMIGGILKKVRNSGELESITAQVVYQNDHFDYALGDDEHITHKPLLTGDRGNPIISYAIAKTKDGGIYREVMTEAQVMAVKNVSRSKGGPWSGPFADEMRRKTVLRRLSKRLPMSTDLEGVLEADDELFLPPDGSTPERVETTEKPGLKERMGAAMPEPEKAEAKPTKPAPVDVEVVKEPDGRPVPPDDVPI